MSVIIETESKGGWEFLDQADPSQIDFDPLPPTHEAKGSDRAVLITGKNGVYFEVRQYQSHSRVESVETFLPQVDQIETFGDVIRDESQSPTITYILNGPEAVLRLKTGEGSSPLTIRHIPQPNPKIFDLVREFVNSMPTYIENERR